ncbi:MAG: hypothetical protein A2637_03425 [Candidatus Muproteobacteria bacterium RIFCSPHIGHO2_01_FULL_65_16]|uniref:tRNA (cytidine/uridine-2'-O-)-methyltransferase TrmJ n=1 Tax=Candidatus Muproteobacteria bacterium RIFCSPHIGHO2_01_FULL_65_16 TaxID=1817764 RepID=A0A1F6TMS9_9PROT|nr:MAG: hypothetical protein A2637_03425 [Candidatus Muproteobacteria bacterium RIFCSPHIGHO2_01_FULL_65_16]
MKNIRIVLVRPTHPGNIGAAARAMKNMGLENLHLVAPENFVAAEARARAVGAEDVLARAVTRDSLDAALADCHLVIGASARARRIEWPLLEPKACAEKLIAAAGPAALVFGQERTGLTNAELERCCFVVQIPASPAFPSLNLAAAVQVLAYEIYLAGRRSLEQKDRVATPVSHEDMRQFYRHLEQVLVQTGFLDPSNPRLLMRRLVRLFNRAGLDRNELNILRGILTAVQTRRENS